MQRTVFLDKDGTIIPDIPYNVDPALITLYPEAGPALQKLQRAGYQFVVVSNQAGVARGYFTEDALPAVFATLNELLAPFGVRLAAWYYCPNHPDGTVTPYAIRCGLRKPEPGMLLQAAQEHGINLAHSWMIGDILNDVEAGNRAGCRSILVDRGNETEWKSGPFREPVATVRDLAEAADLILSASPAARAIEKPAAGYSY